MENITELCLGTWNQARSLAFIFLFSNSLKVKPHLHVAFAFWVLQRIIVGSEKGGIPYKLTECWGDCIAIVVEWGGGGGVELCKSYTGYILCKWYTRSWKPMFKASFNRLWSSLSNRSRPLVKAGCSFYYWWISVPDYTGRYRYRE